jgi:hypothetical protein
MSSAAVVFGPDYLLHFLVNEVEPKWHYPHYHIDGFARKVKEVCTILTGIEDWDNRNKKEEVIPAFGITRRQMMQKVGTDCMRNGLDEDVWVKALFKDIDGESFGVIIEDVRFPNEIKAIRDRGGILIHVSRRGFSGDPHWSERALDGYNEYDHYIQNNYGYKELVDQIYTLYNENLKKDERIIA